MIATQQCAHEPDPATFTRDDGSPADLLAFADYPVHAVCQECRAPIVTYSIVSPWREDGTESPLEAT